MSKNKNRRLPAGFKERANEDGKVSSLEYRFSVDGNRYSVYGHTVTDCREKELQKRQEIAMNTECRKEPTLDQYYELWSSSRKGSVTESTIRAQYYHFASCSDVVIDTTDKRLGDMKMKEISVQDIRTVQQALICPSTATFKPADKNKRIKRRKAQTTNSTNGTIAHLSHVFNSAINERIIDYNPCRPVRNLKRTEPPSRDTIHRALTIEEQKSFFEEAKKSWYFDLFRFLISTGCRIGEAGALTSFDIFDEKIHIRRTVVRDEIGGYVIGANTKTVKGNRDIPLNDQIKSIIKHQMRVTEQIIGVDYNRIKAIKQPETPQDIAANCIFKSPEQTILRNETVDREIARICKRIGIEKITAHAFRATFATRFIEQNPTEVRTLQELLGHADFSLTMNLYGHVMEDTKKEAMKSIIIAI